MSAELRNSGWLEARLKYLWDHHFSDAPTGYPIHVKFGRPARYRFGSICNQGRRCQILINGLFAHTEVPEFVVDATLAHELAHYVHGYGSGLAKLHSHPHRGGVIDKEMQARGCFHLEEMAGQWRREHWQAFFLAHAPLSHDKATAREQAAGETWERYLASGERRSLQEVQACAAGLAARFGMDTEPFQVEWLASSLRRTGVSYRFRREGKVKLQGLLADRRVPAEVIEYELAYWLAVERVGGNWDHVEAAMKAAGVWPAALKAIRWRRRAWPAFRKAHHPLAAAKN